MRKYLRHVSGRLLPRDWPYPIVRGPLRGTRFILGAGAGAGGGASVYFNLVEPEQTKAFCEMVHRGNTVFDIGANVGYYTLLASSLVGDKGLVVAFEPAVRNLSYLYRHVSLNRATNVMIVPAACSATCFLGTFRPGENCATGHLDLGGNSPVAQVSGPITPVMVASLDAIVLHTNLPPDVIKIDVEGAELEVLKGANETLLRGTPLVFLSVHSDKLRTACLGFLEEKGYVCKPLSGGDLCGGEWLATKR
jgi:FkbM family methyltransferase